MTADRPAFVTLLVLCVLAAGCRDQQPSRQRSLGVTRILKLEELSEAEKRYGHSAAHHPAVTYQPDVVLVPDGAEAIRGVSPDGLTWTIDPGAEEARNIRPGKVLLLTSRAAGRVLAVRRLDEGLRVVLGPVEITEVIRDGRFTLDQPLDLDQALSFPAPEVFDPVYPIPPIVTSSASGAPSSLAGTAPCSPSPAGHTVVLASAGTRRDCDPAAMRVSPAGTDQKKTAHSFTVTPLVGSQGIGVRIASQADGVRFLGEARLHLKAPTMYFNLDIKGGKIVTCEVRLNGAAGLGMKFESAAPRPTDANINERRYVPVDFSIPITGMGVPFAVTVRQIFQLQTVFTSTGLIKAEMYYGLKGGLRAGYRDGKWSAGGPTGVTPVQNLDNMLLSMQGVALGVTGMVMTHQASVMVGIGAFGFLTGPYGFLNSSVTVTRSSDASIGHFQGPMACKQGTVTMAVGAGVGYRMPEPVTGAINAILRALNIREEIQGSGGLETKPAVIVSMGRYHPSLDICKN